MKSSKISINILAVSLVVAIAAAMMMLFAWAHTNNVACGIAALLIFATVSAATILNAQCSKAAGKIIDLLIK